MFSNPRPFAECAMPSKPTADLKTLNMWHAPGLGFSGSAAAGPAATPADAAASAAVTEMVAIRFLLIVSSLGR